MANGKLFGDRAVGAVAIVEAPVSQWYMQRARIAFVTVSMGAALVAAALMAVFLPLPFAVALGLLVGAVCGLVAGVLVRTWPVLRVLWWWSIELTVAAVVVVGPSLLARRSSPWLALTGVLVTVALCVRVHPLRRCLAAWSWCVVTHHRLRLCFAGIVRGSGAVRPGSLPLLLWARPTPAGERVWLWLWLRPGLDLADLDGKTGRIAVTCWAKQVRVVAASERYAALIRVDIARRDPLAAEVKSPLALLIPSLRTTKNADVPVSPAVPPAGLDLADIPEPPVSDPRGGRR